MKDLHVIFTMDCEAIAEFSSEGGPPDWDFSRRAITGFCEELLKNDLRATLFVVPKTAEKQNQLFSELELEGIEIGLHFHPQDHGYKDYLGGFDGEQQYKMISEAANQYAQGICTVPASFRGGNLSGNDYTYPVLESLGFKQGSLSTPERNFTRVRANWKGALFYPHHTHRANRLIEGDMEFLEVPISIDHESIMWGGLSPLELRLEMVDARSHGFTIRKVVAKQLKEEINLVALALITHNTFDYSNPLDFRNQVLKGVIEEIGKCAEANEMAIKGTTLKEFHEIFDLNCKKG